MAKKKDDLVGKVGWFLGLFGVLMFIFGMLLFFMPTITIASAIFFFGVLLVVGGVFKLVEALFCMKGSKMAPHIAIAGIVSLIVGLVLVLAPSAVTTGVIFAFGGIALVLAFLALVVGITQIVYALGAKKKLFPLAVGFILAIVGLLMLLNPFNAAIAIIMLMGLFSVTYGVALIVLALSIRELLT